MGHQPFQRIGQIGFVVGGEAQFRPRPQHPRQFVQHLHLQETALVMPGLGPGIGEQQEKAAERSVRQGRDDVPPVAFIDPNIVQRIICKLCQKLGDAHLIGLGPDQADIRILAGKLKQVFARAKPDLQPQFPNSVRKLGKCRSCRGQKQSSLNSVRRNSAWWADSFGPLRRP